MADRYAALKMTGLSKEEQEIFMREIALNIDTKRVQVFTTFTDFDGNLYLEAAGSDPEPVLTELAEYLTKIAGTIEQQSRIEPTETKLRTKDDLKHVPVDERATDLPFIKK